MINTINKFSYQESPHMKGRNHAIFSLSDKGLNDYISSCAKVSCRVESPKFSLNDQSESSDYICITENFDSDVNELISSKTAYHNNKEEGTSETNKNYSEKLKAKIGYKVKRNTVLLNNQTNNKSVSKEAMLSPLKQIPSPYFERSSIQPALDNQTLERLCMPLREKSQSSDRRVISSCNKVIPKVYAKSDQSLISFTPSMSPTSTTKLPEIKLPHIESISDKHKYMGSNYNPYNFNTTTSKNRTKRNVYGTLFVN